MPAPSSSPPLSKSSVYTAAEPFAHKYEVCRLLYERKDTATSVFLCQDRDTRERVVVKRYFTQEHNSNRNSAATESFMKELDVARLLLDSTVLNLHPGVVTILDVQETSACGRSNASAFVVMEYCSGGDLFSFLEHQPSRRLEERQALRLFQQVVQGVAHLHALGIAHLDISLENVLLDSHGCAKVCDFGLSASARNLSNRCVGRPMYIAPEALSTAGGLYDPVLADVWSLGILLFIMLTGSPLFRVASPSDIAWHAVELVGVPGILKHWGLRSLFCDATVELLSDLLVVKPVLRIPTLRHVLERLASHPLLA